MLWLRFSTTRKSFSVRDPTRQRRIGTQKSASLYKSGPLGRKTDDALFSMVAAQGRVGDDTSAWMIAQRSALNGIPGYWGVFQE